jgi:hypothetical protein
MRQEILSQEQIDLLPVIKIFSKNFGLVGGTAIALHVGHRRSIDFDLFSYERFDNNRIKDKLFKTIKSYNPIVDKLGELTFETKTGVKMTFYNFPYRIDFTESLDKIIKMPDLLTLAAMKAFALGQRAKWKDYVDLYFVIKNFHSIKEINKKGRELFGGEYSEKLFKIQLSYFNDVNYGEEVEFMPGFAVSERKIKKELIEFSLIN